MGIDFEDSALTKGKQLNNCKVIVIDVIQL